MDKRFATSNLILATPLQPSLPSWNDGASKRAIMDFVHRVTCKESRYFVPRQDRIAVFDNDGTLWPEKPLRFQAAFAIDRMKLLANHHAKWTEAPLAHAILAGDLDAIATASERQVQEILAATHAGLSSKEFEKVVGSWLAIADHPVFRRRYAELSYCPMQELVAYLRANGFKTFIASCGGVEFIRVLASQAYDIPPEQVIGSSIATHFEFQAGQARLLKHSKIDFVEDGPGKPSGIDRFIGRCPIFAIGNSDGDQQMLEWTAAGEGVRFVGLLHHTDSDREFAYDRESQVGRLARLLVEARARNWAVIDMAKDWARVFSEREAAQN